MHSHASARASKCTYMKPGDVRKLFRRNDRFTARVFPSACQLLGIGEEDTRMLFQLIKSTFLAGPACNYFMDVVEAQAKAPEEAVQMLENHYHGR